MLLESNITDVAVPGGARLSTVVRSFFEWFFTAEEVTAYAPWFDLITIIGTLFLVALFFRLLFSPLFPRKNGKR